MSKRSLPERSTSVVSPCRAVGRFELFRVMQLSPQGFHDQTDQGIRNGIDHAATLVWVTLARSPPCSTVQLPRSDP